MNHSRIIATTLSSILVLLISAHASAQNAQSLPEKFALPQNPIELGRYSRKDVYFDAVGRKAAIFARESGTFESWVFPMKLFHNAAISISIEGQDSPIDFSSSVDKVIARPESTTLVATNQLFTIKATYFTPINEQGSIILLDIDTARPMTLTISFVPDLKPMWPGGLGGQSAGWRDDLKAFVISESRRKYNAFFGSPGAVRGVATPAHQLASGALRFDIKVDPKTARKPFLSADHRRRNQRKTAGHRSLQSTRRHGSGAISGDIQSLPRPSRKDDEHRDSGTGAQSRFRMGKGGHG
ncbi:MAG: hypothetical protein IPJ07_01450 [Acidobacteria bacterium]|nr:hypothetical protein [Acidobacteriota bacterium]